MPRVSIRKVEHTLEHRLLTAMITSDLFLQRLLPLWDAELVETPFVRTVGQWCVDHFEQYSTAPGKDVKRLFEHHSRKGMDAASVEMTEQFLERLNADWKQFSHINVPYLLDQTQDKFRARSLALHAADVETMAEAGQLDEAEEAVASYNRVKIPSGDEVDPFTNMDALQQSFEDDAEPLFKLPGALGSLVNDSLVREGLIAFMGPEKRGKTFWLTDISMRAFQARNNVAFFAVGDMGRRRMIRRMMIRLAGRNDRAKYCGKFWEPVIDCRLSQQDECNMRCRESDCGTGTVEESMGPEELVAQAPTAYTPCTACRSRTNSKWRGAVWWTRREVRKPLDWPDAWKLSQQFVQRTKGCRFKLSVHPNNTLTVSEMRGKLTTWEEMEGFVPDVIVVDYADVMASEHGRFDKRDQENAKWQDLRATAQIRRALVVTATQADAASYDARSLKMKNFSEDKRKYAHVTGMLGLNQQGMEKPRGVMRVGWLVAREEEYTVGDEVTVLGCLRRGRPFMDSYW